jgi:hypothetical protein
MPTQESNESWIATCTVFGRTNSPSNAEDLRGAGSIAVDMRRAALQWSTDRLHLCQLFTAASGPVLLRLVGGGRSSWPRRVPDAVFTLPASQDPLLCVSPEIDKSCRHIYPTKCILHRAISTALPRNDRPSRGSSEMTGRSIRARGTIGWRGPLTREQHNAEGHP